MALVSPTGSATVAVLLRPSGLAHLVPIGASLRGQPTFQTVPAAGGGRKAVVHDLQRPEGSLSAGDACSLAARGPLLAVGWAGGSCSLLRLEAVGSEYSIAQHELCRAPAAGGRILRSLISRQVPLPCASRVRLLEEADQGL